MSATRFHWVLRRLKKWKILTHDFIRFDYNTDDGTRLTPSFDLLQKSI